MYNIETMKEKYVLYSENWLDKISKKGITAGDDIKTKVQHGLSMCDAVKGTTVRSKFFNESYAESGAIDGLLHDVGRFPQYYLSGTLKDTESEKNTGFRDHGQYGAHILNENNGELLRYFLGNNKEYDKIISEIVKEHTTITNPEYLLNLESLINVFQNYDISEVINGNNKAMINKLIALKLLILREEDSLEILHKVKDKLWRPSISSEKESFIKDYSWNLFKNFGYLNMKELKEKGLWNCNTGFLLRYSLIFHNVNFVGTLKNIIAEDLIRTVYLNQINNVTNGSGEKVTDPSLHDKRLKEAYLYTLEAVKNLIETSPDGKIITADSREKAKDKTIKLFR